jgi:hypothetical protein
MDADFLVIGAGLGGLAFAGDTAAAGHRVVVLDKGRGVGGRAATRRWNDDLRVDHGAQFFTARGARFRAFVEAALGDGWLRVWSHGFPLYENSAITIRPPGYSRYAPPGGMSDLPKRLAAGLDVRTGVRVTGVERMSDGGGYRATDEDGRVFGGSRLVLNMPPEQILGIADGALSAEEKSALDAVRFAPAWTWVARLERDIPVADWPALEFADHPALGWVSRDHTKRAGPDAPPVLVVHGNGAWSAAHREDSPESVAHALSEACESVFGPLAVRDAFTHRWRFAQPTQPTQPAGQPFLYSAETGIGMCGDWCGPGGRIEGALTSGWELAAAVMRDAKT